MDFIKKHCLFCQDKEDLVELYPQTFTDQDLTPEVFSARRITEHFHYAIVRCRNCGLVFSREILPDEILSRLYSQSNVTFGEYMDIIRRDYWRSLAPFMDGVHRGEALEIGCSTGFFLEELLAQGFQDVCGCEPSIEAKEMAGTCVRGNITSGFFKEGLYENRRFDLVCSFQTLDHLGDPVKVIRISNDILKPGGLAYFITHNVDGLQAKILGEKSPIIDVEHVYLFNKVTLRRLLEMTGFEVMDVSNVRNSYPLEYWLKMFPLAKTVKNVMRNSFKRLGLSSVPVPLKAGNIYIVGKRRHDL